MITLTYTLLALSPMVLGLVALLVGWAIGLVMSSPIPQYDADRSTKAKHAPYVGATYRVTYKGT